MDQAAVGALKKVPLHAARSVRGRGESIDFTAGVTGKGGIWQKKPPDAESARLPRVTGGVGATDPKVQALGAGGVGWRF